MATAVATQAIEAGDVLRRFKAEASKHGPPRRGNTNSSDYSRGRCLHVLAAHEVLLNLCAILFLFLIVFTRVCVLLFVLVRACMSSLQRVMIRL